MKNQYKVVIIEGDGIGPEISKWAVAILDKEAKKHNMAIELDYKLLGGALIDQSGVPINEDTINACKAADAVFLGAVGHPKYNELDLNLRPEYGLLTLRKEMGVYANLRPAMIFEPLKEHSPLKLKEDDNLNMVIVRELTGGIYFGKKYESPDKTFCYDQLTYTREEIERITKMAFEIAMTRDKKLTSIDKANVLQTSRMWRSIVNEIHSDYPDVTVEHLYVDNAAMQFVINPSQFDVVLTSNMFGDILSDEMSVITGSIGVLPSASINQAKKGLYEPIHGSAPDIAGENLANPIASILSIAMMFEHTFERSDIAEEISRAVNHVLESGFRTRDILSDNTKLVTTDEMGALILEVL